MAGNLAVLYDVEWQVMRCEMLTDNNRYGGWWSDFGVDYNANLCMDYVEAADVGGLSEVEQHLRRWRVVNLCNATLLGYGNRSDAQEEWRERLRLMRSGLEFDTAIVSAANDVWDWRKVAEDVADMSHHNRKMVLRNLKKRAYTSARRNGKTNTFKHRTELERFIGLLEAY